MQRKLLEKSEITAFQTPLGLYQFKVMPFRLLNASTSFTRLMRKLIQVLHSIDNFIDDVIIFTRIFQDHLLVDEEFLRRLRTAEPYSKSKQVFHWIQQPRMFGIQNEKLKPIPEKVETIQNSSRPTTKKQVRSFLGLVGFYRKFIPNFSAVASPLSDLTKKGLPNKVVWGESQQNAFLTLKSALMVTPVSKLPNINGQFILQTDASNIGIGAVLLQYENDIKKPVAYASKTLKWSQKVFHS